MENETVTREMPNLLDATMETHEAIANQLGIKPDRTNCTTWTAIPAANTIIVRIAKADEALKI